MEIPASLPAAFPPSPDALLEITRVQIDNDMLREISRADYGVGAGEIYEELLPIRNRGVVPSPLPFWVHEVCSLTQYSTPDPPFFSGPPDFRTHWIRLFACAVPLRAAGETERLSGSDDITLAQTLSSTKILGAEVSHAAARFLTWRFSSLTYNYNSTHLPWHLALLILAVRLRAGRFTDSQLTEIAQWVLYAEAKYLEDCPVYVSDPPPTRSGGQAGYWTPLVAEVHFEADKMQDAGLRERLKMCAMMMEN